MRLYNTLTRQEEEIKASNSDGVLRVYSCGPTVYSRQHIGNYRAYINWDIFHRALLYLGYKVKRIVNITDVGHLTSDDDWGEDKMEKGAKLSGKSAAEIADFFIRTYLEDLAAINVMSPSGEKVDPAMDLSQLKEHNWTRATEYVDAMIELNKMIESNGYAYETDQALYFDVSKYPDYTKLSGQKLSEKIVGAREEVNQDPGKRNPADFVIWMKTKGQYANHLLHWPSPWGDGFPGWHLECSAMGWKELGDSIDVHTGGIEHIGTHHTNEIAQNFGAHQKDIVNIWTHNEHLQSISGDKLAKSKGNAFTLPELMEKGYSPMDFRYLIASINYKMPVKFSFEALDGAKNARLNLVQKLQLLKSEGGEGQVLDAYKKKFVEALENNLNMSEAFAVLSSVMKSAEKAADIVATVLDFDRVLGLQLDSSLEDSVPEQVKQLLEQREQARKAGDYALADRLRDEVAKNGYSVLDTAGGQKISKLEK
jgi:cysteinyl-tRNA synthetase